MRLYVLKKINRFMILKTVIMSAFLLSGPAFGFEGSIVSVGPEIVKVQVDGRIGLFKGDQVSMLNRGFLDAITGRFVVKSVSQGLVELVPISIDGIIENGMQVGLKVINKGDEAAISQTAIPSDPIQLREAFTGKVIKVDKNAVTIKVKESGMVLAKSRVDLYFKMPSGSEMAVGQWKVIKTGEGTIDAVPVDMIGRPKVGLIAKIVPPSYQESAQANSMGEKTAAPLQKNTTSQALAKSKEAHADAGNIYLRQENYEMAFKEFEQASYKGHDDAQRLLGQWYLDGLHVAQDNEKARFWLEKSAGKNNPAALYSLGLLYSRENYLFHDMKKAYDLFLRSADLGYSRAQYNLGIMRFKGMAMPIDYAQSLQWFEKAAEQNLPEGLYMVGYIYENGNGVTKNRDRAMAYYKKAAELGEKRAIRKLSTP